MGVLLDMNLSPAAIEALHWTQVGASDASDHDVSRDAKEELGAMLNAGGHAALSAF